MHSTYPQTERNESICAKFRAGKTPAEIGCEYGVSRQRIQQILAKAGICWRDGGKHLLVAAAQAKASEELRKRRDNRSMRAYGCSYADLVALNMGMAPSDIGSPAFKYREQRKNARRVGADFRIDFPAWVGLFQRAGGLFNRGQFSDGLVLGRKDKSKGFTLDNVHVVTLSENTRNTRIQALQRAA